MKQIVFLSTLASNVLMNEKANCEVYVVWLCQASSDVKTPPALTCLTSCCWIPSTAQSLCCLHSHVKSMSQSTDSDSYGCNEQWCGDYRGIKNRAFRWNNTSCMSAQLELTRGLFHLLTWACLSLLIVCGLCTSVILKVTQLMPSVCSSLLVWSVTRNDTVWWLDILMLSRWSHWCFRCFPGPVHYGCVILHPLQKHQCTFYVI